MVTKVIRVRKSHIKNGQKDDVYSCPIALALKSAKVGYPFVSGSSIAIRHNGGWLFSMPHTKATSKFINYFDGGMPVKPFSFKIRVTNAVAVRLGWLKPKKGKTK